MNTHGFYDVFYPGINCYAYGHDTAGVEVCENVIRVMARKYRKHCKVFPGFYWSILQYHDDVSDAVREQREMDDLVPESVYKTPLTRDGLRSVLARSERSLHRHIQRHVTPTSIKGVEVAVMWVATAEGNPYTRRGSGKKTQWKAHRDVYYGHHMVLLFDFKHQQMVYFDAGGLQFFNDSWRNMHWGNSQLVFHFLTSLWRQPQFQQWFPRGLLYAAPQAAEFGSIRSFQEGYSHNCQNWSLWFADLIMRGYSVGQVIGMLHTFPPAGDQEEEVCAWPADQSYAQWSGTKACQSLSVFTKMLYYHQFTERQLVHRLDKKVEMGIWRGFFADKKKCRAAPPESERDCNVGHNWCRFRNYTRGYPYIHIQDHTYELFPDNRKPRHQHDPLQPVYDLFGPPEKFRGQTAQSFYTAHDSEQTMRRLLHKAGVCFVPDEKKKKKEKLVRPQLPRGNRPVVTPPKPKKHHTIAVGDVITLTTSPAYQGKRVQVLHVAPEFVEVAVLKKDGTPSRRKRKFFWDNIGYHH